MKKVKHWLGSLIIFFRHVWAIGKPQQSQGSKTRSMSSIRTDFLTQMEHFLFSQQPFMRFLHMGIQLTPFKKIEGRVKNLRQWNNNLIRYLGSGNFIGNRTCRKSEMQVIWHFVASWESPGAGNMSFRHAWPWVIGVQWPELLVWERKRLAQSCLAPFTY